MCCWMARPRRSGDWIVGRLENWLEGKRLGFGIGRRVEKAFAIAVGDVVVRSKALRGCVLLDVRVELMGIKGFRTMDFSFRGSVVAMSLSGSRCEERGGGDMGLRAVN